MAGVNIDNVGRLVISKQVTTLVQENSVHRMVIATSPQETTYRVPVGMVKMYLVYAATMVSTRKVPEVQPMGYLEFVECFNAGKQEYKLPYVEYGDDGTSRWVIPEYNIPHYMLSADHYNPHGQLIDPRLITHRALDTVHPGFVCDKFLEDASGAFRTAMRSLDPTTSAYGHHQRNRNHPYERKRRVNSTNSTLGGGHSKPKPGAAPFYINIDDGTHGNGGDGPTKDTTQQRTASSSKPKPGPSGGAAMET